jgi:threonylcarbamoyladenosine tRNA methylthiotransferase MtaB
MPQQIKDKVKQERNRRMLELARSSRRKFCEQFLGQTMPLLWEKETSPGSGIYSGLTGNYIRVLAHSEKTLDNEITSVKLVGFHNPEMRGELVNENPG